MTVLSAPGAGSTWGEPMAGLLDIASLILDRNRSHLLELKLDGVIQGVVLRGRARSYYGKQISLCEVLRRGITVLANEIVVI
jgi:hypothetical protein